MRLCDDKVVFQRLIEMASRKLNIAEQFIEKDYYAISLLKELVKRDNDLVFKGGTSLSVCHQVINRFSEDIDVSYSLERITTSIRKRIKYDVFIPSIDAVGLQLTNNENIRSRRIFNRYLCSYDSLWGDYKGSVVAEWATQTPSFPIETRDAQTIIGRYLESINRLDLVEKYDLQSFKTKTLAKERTLVDKIFAICDYHISGVITRQSRHIYDIHQLLPFVALDEGLIDLFLKVKGYRSLIDNCYSAKEGKMISNILLDLIDKRTYYSDYQNRTYPLLYDHVKYEECVKSIVAIADFLKVHTL